MQVTSVSTLSTAISSALLLLVACTDGSMRRLDDGSDGGPGGVGGSCMGVETLCGSVS